MNIRNNLLSVNPIVKTILLLLLATFGVFSETLLSKFFLMLVSVLVFFSVSLNFEFKTLKNMFVFIILACISNIFCSSGVSILRFGPINITNNSLPNFLFMFFSMSTLFINSLIMIKSISFNEVPCIASFFLSPLKRLGVDTSEISMVITLVLRFIPIVLKESKKVVLAQESRGAKILHGTLSSRIKYIFPIFIPILISCFRRAINIATSMECRCYSAPFEKTSLKENKITKIDIISIIAVALVLFGVFVCNMVKIFYLF